MKSTTRWLKKQHWNNQNFISIHDLFYTGSRYKYIFFRLKIFNLQLIARYAYYLILFSSAYQIVPSADFGIVAGLFIIQEFITSWWWGALETLRGQVRHRYHAHDEHGVDAVISNYLYLTAIIACVFCASLLALTAYLYWNDYISHLIAVFMVVLAVKLPVNLLLRVFHSGAYAITRIIRTPISVIAPDAIAILVINLISLDQPEYAWIIAFGIHALVNALLTYNFVRRMYRFYNITVQKPKRPQFKRFLQTFPLGEFIYASTAYALIHIDALMPLVMAYFLENNFISNEVFFFCLLISPVFNATSDWAFLFYFDRKKIRGTDYAKTMKFYNDCIVRVSVLMAVIYWSFAVYAVSLFFDEVYLYYITLLLPLFMVKSVLADSLIKRYSYKGYKDIIVILSAMMLFIGATIVNLGLNFESYCIILAFLSLAAKFTYRPRYRPYRSINYFKIPIGFYGFLLKLSAASKEKVTVYSLTAVDHINITQTYFLLDELSRKFIGFNGEVCFVDDNHFMFFTKDKELTHYDILLACSGLVSNIEQLTTHSAAEFQDAISRKDSLFGKVLPAEYFDPDYFVPDDELLKQRFFNLFPHGIYYDPMPTYGPKAKPQSLEETRSLYTHVIQYLYFTRNKRAANFTLSLTYREAQVQTLFVIPKHTASNQEREQWATLVHIYNLRNSLVPYEDVPDMEQVFAS